tara:strand:+ start:2624 stop:3079 length:456 start_codon:yes stop_codon:yes gene_type:complete
MVSTRASLSTLDDDDDEAISDDARRAERHPPRHADAVDVSIVFPFVVVVRPENKVVFVFGRPDEAFGAVAVPETVAVVGRIFRRRRRRRRRRLSKKQFRVVSMIGPKSQSRSRRSRRRSRGHRSIFLESGFSIFLSIFSLVRYFYSSSSQQ